MNRYSVRYEKDDTDWWVATVLEINGCHTQGRSIRQARSRIREALGLFVDNADSAELVEEIVPPAGAKPLLKRLRVSRKRAEEEAAKVQSTAAEAALFLTKDVGVSIRDAGELLDLSHQRVQQLLAAEARKRKK